MIQAIGQSPFAHKGLMGFERSMDSLNSIFATWSGILISRVRTFKKCAVSGAFILRSGTVAMGSCTPGCQKLSKSYPNRTFPMCILDGIPEPIREAPESPPGREPSDVCQNHQKRINA